MREYIKILIKNDFVSLLLIGVIFFGFYKYINWDINREISDVRRVNEELIEEKDIIKTKIGELEKAIFDTLGALEEEEENNSSLKEKLNDIKDTVGKLEKLSTLDKELLMKYSKVYFLNEHYTPLELSDIDEEYRTKNSTNYKIHSKVLPYLKNLIEKGREDGVDILVQSAYRSFKTQSELKSNYTVTYGITTSNRFSADQGYSEHQLGTTVDFTTRAMAGVLLGFDKTPEYTWLIENAHKYGFILSYPLGNAYYKFEPWHWRFVGVELAQDLKKQNVYFYDMDQRIIDSYLTKIFD